MTKDDTGLEFYKATYIAKCLGLSRQRIYQLCDEGVLPHLRIGQSIVFPARAWEQWLAEANEEALQSVKEAGNG